MQWPISPQGVQYNVITTLHGLPFTTLATETGTGYTGTLPSRLLRVPRGIRGGRNSLLGENASILAGLGGKPDFPHPLTPFRHPLGLARNSLCLEAGQLPPPPSGHSSLLLCRTVPHVAMEVPPASSAFSALRTAFPGSGGRIYGQQSAARPSRGGGAQLLPGRAGGGKQDGHSFHSDCGTGV